MGMHEWMIKAQAIDNRIERISGGKILGFIALVLVITGVVYFSMENRNPAPTDRYCDMIEVHQQTGGEYGWPDYKDIAKHCQ